MKTRLDKSIEYIRGYCSKYSICEECKLYNYKRGRCSLKSIPLSWETLQESRKAVRNEQKELC